MTDLREAAQQALECLRILDYVTKRSPRFDKAIIALEAALAAPQPEPVAFYDFGRHQMRWAKPTVYAEIVAVNVPELPLYTHPQERQPLTLDQVSMIWSRVYPAQPLSQNVLNLVREVEAAHGIGGDK